MSDLPELDYTINDPSSISCPYCHKTREFDCSIVMDTTGEMEISCPHCHRDMVVKVSLDITVLAWKSEALR